MLINEKAGSVNTIAIGTRTIDKLLIEWYEVNKRIMHKQTQSGKAITLKFLQQTHDLKDSDILWQDEDVVIAVEIKPCEAIVIKPATIFEAASVCYEIGNKHLPLFYEGDELLVPYEALFYRLLQPAGYAIKVEERKLTNAVKTTVFPHAPPWKQHKPLQQNSLAYNFIIMFQGDLLHLLHLSDPALPIGGFSHSWGLETYVHESIVKDKHSAKKFIEQQLSQNIFYTDAALVSLVYDAAGNNDLHTILQLEELCNAVKLPKETRHASNKLGLCLLKIFQQNSDLILVNKYIESIKKQHAFGHYSIAFGLLSCSLNINKSDALAGFYYNAAAGFVTNSVKLVPLGQQEGQEILVSLFPLIYELARLSISPDKDLIGFSCAGFDLRCMQHEQLYSRLYMS